MKKLFFYTIVLFNAIFMMSSCQDSYDDQTFVLVIETENENDTYKIEYISSYINGKERTTTQIDTLGKIFYTTIRIGHTSTGQRIEYTPITIKRVDGNGEIKLSIIEFNNSKTLTFKDLPESLQTSNNTLSNEDLDWVHNNSAYSILLQPLEKEKEILIKTYL